MSKLVKGLLFDLDGTLCDTNEANFLAYQKAFSINGFSLTNKQFNGVKSLRSDYFIPKLVPGISKHKIISIQRAKANAYIELVKIINPNLQLINFIRLMKPLHKIALVTTASKKNALAVLEEVGLKGMFDVLVFGDDVGRPKPDPEAYYLALTQLQLKPHQVVAFEDSEVGITAAQSAQIQVIQVGIV